MGKYVSGVWTRPNAKVQMLSKFEPVLKTWIKLHKKYCRTCSGDTSFFYGEQAHVSVLCSAIWQSGGVSMAEFSHEKTSEDKQYAGRCDLWGCSGNEQKESYSFYMEAKNIEGTLAPNTDWSRRLQALLHDAIGSAGETQIYGVNMLAIGFSSLWLPKSKLPKYAGLRDAYIKALHPKNDIKIDASAWLFFKNPIDGYDEGYVHCGTSLVIKAVVLKKSS